ncbi:hypothetical protein B0I35DRAFT_166428 [Stachybotrys elegans]|uniref:Uncharacterized protein n=1 Tax=Stachybotrys elegans TaxID=80388 RepID=A0A8K0T107_9HYPO|nr:hypothetical protein B0I35DRAFT_166428 [Stachybotrys elegans]
MGRRSGIPSRYDAGRGWPCRLPGCSMQSRQARISAWNRRFGQLSVVIPGRAETMSRNHPCPHPSPSPSQWSRGHSTDHVESRLVRSMVGNIKQPVIYPDGIICRASHSSMRTAGKHYLACFHLIAPIAASTYRHQQLGSPIGERLEARERCMPWSPKLLYLLESLEIHHTTTRSSLLTQSPHPFPLIKVQAAHALHGADLPGLTRIGGKRLLQLAQLAQQTPHPASTDRQLPGREAGTSQPHPGYGIALSSAYHNPTSSQRLPKHHVIPAAGIKTNTQRGNMASCR